MKIKKTKQNSDLFFNEKLKICKRAFVNYEKNMCFKRIKSKIMLKKLAQ